MDVALSAKPIPTLVLNLLNPQRGFWNDVIQPIMQTLAKEGVKNAVQLRQMSLASWYRGLLKLSTVAKPEDYDAIVGFIVVLPSLASILTLTVSRLSNC
jgi:hypothetical protein